jgi:hypothetical protein
MLEDLPSVHPSFGLSQGSEYGRKSKKSNSPPHMLQSYECPQQLLLSTMSQLFKSLPSHAPDLVVRNDTSHDPFAFVDDAGKSAETKRKADTARSKASDEIDWIPQHLKDLIDQHRPKDGDIDASGNANKARLTEEAEKLFGKIQKDMVFVNFYQLKQMVQRFAGYWGFFVITQNNTQLTCFFAESSRRPHQSTVSPSKQRDRETLKTGCDFVIRATPHNKLKNTERRHRTPVRISSFKLKHGDQCKPGLMEQRMAKKAAGAVFGGSSKKQKVVPVSRTKIVQACATLTDLVCSTNVKPEMSVAIFASILQLQDIARGGQPVDRVDKVVETAQQATQSRALQLRHDPEATKEEEPAQQEWLVR